MQLAHGVYQIRFANVSPVAAQFQWRLKIGSVDWEKIIGNGVGQGAALALSLLSPAVTDSAPASAPDFQGPALLPAASVGAGPSGPVPSNLLITLNTSLLGQPGYTASALASVGPSVEGSSVALAGWRERTDPGIALLLDHGQRFERRRGRIGRHQPTRAGGSSRR